MWAALRSVSGTIFQYISTTSGRFFRRVSHFSIRQGVYVGALSLKRDSRPQTLHFGMKSWRSRGDYSDAQLGEVRAIASAPPVSCWMRLWQGCSSSQRISRIGIVRPGARRRRISGPVYALAVSDTVYAGGELSQRHDANPVHFPLSGQDGLRAARQWNA